MRRGTTIRQRVSGRGLPGGQTFNPTQLSGCVLWLRADLGITLNAGNVSAWADQSGSGNNTTQGTASAQPAYTASDTSYNGQPTITLTNTNNKRLKSTTTPSVSQPFTVVIVGQANADGLTSSFFESYAVSGSALYKSAANKLSLYAGTALTSGTAAINAPCVMAGTYSSSTGTGYVNNSQVADSSGAVNSNGLTNPLYVGGDDAGNFAAAVNGKVAEVIAYNSALTAAQLQQVFRYLGNRYGISTS